MVPIHVQGCNVLTQTLQSQGTKGDLRVEHYLDHRDRLRRGHHGRFLSSGPNRPNGFILTTGLGIAGAFVATFIGQTIGWYRLDQGAGLIGATVGALLVLFMEPAGGTPPYVRSRQPAPRPQHAAAPLALGIFKERAREVRPDGLASVPSGHR
jgi:uncharacterized membrane protein YeaQ/YmgE (transglycosylase-associated protein family)